MMAARHQMSMIALGALAAVVVGVVMAQPPANLPKGLDVSGYQGNVDWASVKAKGATFAYIKATEGTNYRSPSFNQQYTGSYNAGLIRGSYHFALPDRSTGDAQANYFVAHGGGWSKDGKTLPGALDIEYNPYTKQTGKDTCYGLSQAEMRTWIHAFVNRYHTLTNRWPTIYTTTDWWTRCTGNDATLASTCPLWVARYSSSVGTLPGGWRAYSFWQYADHGEFPGDQNVWNGSADRLKVMACDGPC